MCVLTVTVSKSAVWLVATFTSSVMKLPPSFSNRHQCNSSGYSVSFFEEEFDVMMLDEKEENVDVTLVKFQVPV